MHKFRADKKIQDLWLVFVFLQHVNREQGVVADSIFNFTRKHLGLIKIIYNPTGKTFLPAEPLLIRN